MMKKYRKYIKKKNRESTYIGCNISITKLTLNEFFCKVFRRWNFSISFTMICCCMNVLIYSFDSSSYDFDSASLFLLFENAKF